MPNCFQLYRKDAPERASFLNTEVDPDIAQHMGVPVHDKQWCHDWYHVIGFLIACQPGCDLGSAELRRQVEMWYDGDGDRDTGYRSYVASGRMTEERRLESKAAMLRILDYLEANYTSNAFVSRHKQ